jgi:hypothetical protein
MYRTFKRSCTNWKDFGSARKITDERGLTLEEARRRCDDFNNNRTAAQVKKGTKMEFEQE